MTPAIITAKKLKLDYSIHEYEHDPQSQSYGLEAAEKMQVDAKQVFKTLVVMMDTGHLAVSILPVVDTLNFKKMAKVLNCKKVKMAEPKLVERSTGYVLGGVSPLGQKKALPTIMHSSAELYDTIYVSAGRRGLEIQLPPAQLAQAVNAQFADIINN